MKSTEEADTATDEQIAAAGRAKKPYAKPELIEFGNVTAITQGGTGSLADGKAMMRTGG